MTNMFPFSKEFSLLAAFYGVPILFDTAALLLLALENTSAAEATSIFSVSVRLPSLYYAPFS